MKIAITDACIFIDLYKLDLTVKFFSLNIELHTTYDVYFELYQEQSKILDAFISLNKLVVHNIEGHERLKIQSEGFPNSLSEVDKTVLYIASKLEAIVLSSDKAVRNCAKTKCINYHGILWVFDKLISENLLTKTEACSKLKELTKLNPYFQNNTKLMKEFSKRLDGWSME